MNQTPDARRARLAADRLAILREQLAIMSKASAELNADAGDLDWCDVEQLSAAIGRIHEGLALLPATSVECLDAEVSPMADAREVSHGRALSIDPDAVRCEVNLACSSRPCPNKAETHACEGGAEVPACWECADALAE